jgi:hypothetical protein
MISHRYRCIFIHIPRCGGSSIEDLIWPPEERTEANLWMGFVRPAYNKYQTGGLQHLLAKQVLAEVGSDIFSSYFKFGIVRNPWDKAVSQYTYMMASRPDLREFANIPDDASFEQYLEHTRKVTHVQWEKQINFVYDNAGKLLVDHLGRFESFDHDVQKILARVGIAAGSIPHVNRSGRPARSDYSVAARELIAETYAADISAFGYSCPWPLAAKGQP